MIDVGTSSTRAVVVERAGSVARVVTEHRRATLPSTPFPGLVELDAAELAAAALELSHAALDETGPVVAVGLANQRGTTIVWDRATGEPVGPGLGWQDLRTVGRCLELRAGGLKVAPNLSGTKVEQLLDQFDPERQRDLCFGTVDTWLAWTLSGGALHITDATNALVTGLRDAANGAWSTTMLEALRIPDACYPRWSTRPVWSGRRARCRVRRRSPGSSATSRRRCSARAACGRAT